MKLVSSSEAAKILGLSLQGIHYRIKKGQLKSEKKDGKIFVYIDENDKKVSSKTLTEFKSSIDSDQLIKAKDDQIKLLKKTIKMMKRQYISEIHRLEQNQTKIVDVFQSEIELLKSAFNEMRSIYQIENKQKQNSIEDENSTKNDMSFMDIKEFFSYMRRYNKTDIQIKQIILDKIKSNDRRFIYNKKSKELIIYKDSFLDLV